MMAVGLYSFDRAQVMATKDDLLNNMSSVPGGGSTERLQDPKVKAKLEKYWGQHTESKVIDSVGMMRARNTAIRLSKGLQPRGEPVIEGPLGSLIGVELHKNNYWEGMSYNLFYPRDCAPGQLAQSTYFSVSVTEEAYFQGRGWLGKMIRESMEKFWESVSKELKQGNGKTTQPGT